MDKNEMKFYEDFSLSETPRNERNTNASAAAPQAAKPSPVFYKTELQVLRLTDGSLDKIMETFSEIHGNDFKLDDISKYKDRGGKSKRLYWEDHGSLIVQGISNFSARPLTGSINSSDDDRIHAFALMKLENYGFDPGHCKEAFKHCNCDTDAALLLLYKRYMRLPDDDGIALNGIDAPSNEEIVKSRKEEKEVLESIYGEAFEEKEFNAIWSVKLKADHLLAYSPSLVRRAQEAELQAAEAAKAAKRAQTKQKGRKDLCRNYQRDGTCKFGDKCRFLHIKLDLDSYKSSAELDWNDNENEHWFFIEIRLPRGNQYPFEAPYIYMKSTCYDIPKNIRFGIIRNLYRAAVESCQHGLGCMYTICQLFQSEECFDNNSPDNFKIPSPQHSIFYVETENEHVLNQQDRNSSLPTHYERGQIARGEGGFKSDAVKVDKENRRLMKVYFDKKNNATYKQMLSVRSKLPAYDKRHDIMKLIEESQVVIISGETGCGKSTQVPQFILDYWLSNEKNKTETESLSHVDIFCTQPRRLSAISLAERVSAELADRLGNIVGYQIRLETKISASTRLTFCTTGILLRRLATDPLLDGLTHVIIDEVHERSDESDFLLLILKRVIETRKDLKVILMSATVNAKLFSDYFGGAPVMNIPGRTFPVKELFLEDFLETNCYTLEMNSTYARKIMKQEEAEFLREMETAGIQSVNVAPPDSIKDEKLNLAATCARYSNCSETTCKTIYYTAPMIINIDLIESVLLYIIGGDHGWPCTGSILIFLPGLNDIQAVLDALKHSALLAKYAKQLIYLPLHSTLSNEEQSAIFKPVPKTKRRIILSTNIAETSITIDDCVFVIDSGLMKEKRFDANRNMESLDLVWVSRANAQQRKGRAGRVMPGVCIHLYTSNRYYKQFPAQTIPELQRIPLDQLVLRIKTMTTFSDMSASDVLNQTLEPPKAENVLNALSRLRNVGALDDRNQLTPLGHHLSALPVDVRIAKLMLYGAIFQCVDSVLTIAACLSHKTPFQSPFSKRTEADKCKRQFAIRNSDHLTILMAYKSWLKIAKSSYIGGRNYANEHYLSLKTLETIADLKYQYLELLVSIGFVNMNVPRKQKNATDNILELTGPDLNKNGENYKLLVSLLCAALYPNVVKVMTPERSYVETLGGALPKPYTSRNLRFTSRYDGYVHLHPSSINSMVSLFASPFLLYQEKIRTSSIFVQDCTMLPLVALVLFAGSDFKVELQDGEFLFLLSGDWIVLKAQNFQTAEVINKLRVELLLLMEDKIKDPCLNLMNHKNAKKLIETIIYIISNNN